MEGIQHIVTIDGQLVIFDTAKAELLAESIFSVADESTQLYRFKEHYFAIHSKILSDDESVAVLETDKALRLFDSLPSRLTSFQDAFPSLEFLE
jgi:hypothetical protein